MRPGAPEVPSDTVALRPLAVLLADDDPVSRRLAAIMLATQGHDVAQANDGLEAVRLASERVFDLVLMDVEMPGLGGLEATQRIRERERGSSGHLPIVALTGHARGSDRERCLSAGMDACIAKPVRRQELLSLVAKLCPARLGSDARPAAASDEPRQELERRLGRDLLAELAGIFLADAPGVAQRLQDALARGDVGEARAAAHQLRGSASVFGADELVEHATRLERAAREGDLAAARGELPALQAAYDQLEELLRAAT